MSPPDNDRPSGLPPDEDAEFDTLFDRLTDASLRPADPGTTATPDTSMLETPALPAFMESAPAEMTRTVSSQPPARSVPSEPPTHRTRSSIPVPSVSLRPSSIVAGVLAHGRSEPPRDPGAETARRTVRKRAGRRGQLAFVGRGAEVVRARAGLLAHLAQRTSGVQRARLWTATAELHAQLDEHEVARALRTRACGPDGVDLIGLRASQRDAEIVQDWPRLIELLQTEAGLALPPVERALALTWAAGVALFHLSDAARACALCSRALAIDPAAIGAALLWITASRSGADRIGEAEGLRHLAHGWKDTHGRVSALTSAGRAYEAAGDFVAALTHYETALGESSNCVDAAWGAMRTARAAGKPIAAAHAASRVAHALHDPEARSAWRRSAARAAASFAHDPTLARELLAEDQSRLGLNLSARVASAIGDPAAHRAALGRWAQATGGSERAVALVELAQMSLDAGEFDAAEQALVDAAVADGNLATIRVVRETLARKRGDATGLANVDTADDDDALTAAAKLGTEPAHARQERELLRRASRQSDDALTAEVIGLDADASAGDREAVFHGALRKAARARPEDRVGALLALLDYLPTDEWGARREEIEHELRASAARSPLALRQRSRSVADVTQRAALWLEESVLLGAGQVSGEHAAFCATVAGHLLAANDRDPTDAYRTAVQPSPIYEPAAWALERCARRQEHTPTLLDIQERLAEQARMPTERAGRLFRAGLLHTTSAPDVASERLHRALTERPADAIVTELLLRLSPSKPSEKLAELLLASTATAGVEAGHAARMRAGALLEDARDWGAAARHYRIAFDADAASEPFTALALDRAEVLAKEHARVAQRRTDAVRDAQDTPSQMVALSQLAEFERDRGDMQSAVLALQSLREVSPSSTQTMRTLERYYMSHQRIDELTENVEAFIEALADPVDVAAYVRFRIALAQAAGESTDAKDRLLTGRVEQTAGDPWSMRREEDAARRAQDPERRWRAVHEQIPHLTDPMERASLCLRALDTAAEHAPSAITALLASAVSAAPMHPIAAEELARLHDLAGDHAAAAFAFEIAARAAYTTERKVSLWYRAGTLWQDHVNDPERALAALREAASLRLLHRDTFTRLHTLLSARSDSDALGTLIEQRIAAGGDASLLANLHADLSSLRGKLQDRIGAKAGLRAALALDATNIKSWHALADLQLADSEWSDAAEALIQLARLSQDTTELRWAFFALGDLYEQKIPDLKRAEIAFSRVVKLGPNDTEAINRLANVFIAQGQLDMAERALQRLADLQQSDQAAWIRARLALADVVEKLADARRAEGILEDARRKYPLDNSINRALAEHHRRQTDDSALAMHLGRAITEYRAAIHVDAGNHEAWLGLVEMLDRRGKRDAADLCAHVAQALDVEAPSIRDRKLPAQAVPAIMSGNIDDLIAPEGLTASTRLVLRQLGPVLEKMLASDTRGPGAERMKTRPDAVQRALTLASAWLGVAKVEVYTNRTRSCHVSETSPWTLTVGDTLLQQTSEAEKLFLFTRALKLAASDLRTALRTDAQLFAGAIRGLIRDVDPAYEPAGVDVATLDEWARRLGKALSRRTIEDIAPNVMEMAGDSHFDPARLAHVCDRFGARAALVATGDFRAAITALLRESGVTLPVGDASQAQRTLVAHPIAGDLLTFAISDACFSARDVALSSTTTSRAGLTGQQGH